MLEAVRLKGEGFRPGALKINDEGVLWEGDPSPDYRG